MITHRFSSKYLQGFTIVEIIVVIAVIGVLATISIVGYGSWQRSTVEAQIKSDLNGAASSLEDYRTFNNEYPTSVPSTFIPSEGVVLAGGSENGKTYCIDATSERDANVKFYIESPSKSNGAQEGTCATRLEFLVTVTTLAGSGASGNANGTGSSASFNSPVSLAVGPLGNIYVVDQGNTSIRKITPSGVVTTLAGSTQGFADGTGVNARFNSYVKGITVDSSGSVYVSDTNNHRIRKITPSGVVTTLAGSTQGFADGTGVNAKFNAPTDIAVDSYGNLYVADSFNSRIRKITPSGVVTTLAGSGEMGASDGVGESATFLGPGGITTGPYNIIYSTGNMNSDNRIRKITPFGAVSTIAGSTNGFTNGTVANAKFNYPEGIAVDSTGIIYIADSNNSRIRKITPSGTVTTLAGGASGFADGIGTEARFSYASGVALDSSGKVIYVADDGNNRIRKITF